MRVADERGAVDGERDLWVQVELEGLVDGLRPVGEGDCVEALLRSLRVNGRAAGGGVSAESEGEDGGQ